MEILEIPGYTDHEQINQAAVRDRFQAADVEHQSIRRVARARAEKRVGRVIHEARVPVIPVFINGLLPNDLGRQVASNFDGTGRKIVVVFGEPIDFTDLYAEPGSPKVHQAIADRTLEVIGRLGQEERVRRAELEG